MPTVKVQNITRQQFDWLLNDIVTCGNYYREVVYDTRGFRVADFIIQYQTTYLFTVNKLIVSNPEYGIVVSNVQ
jgi:hypothetical protein